MQAEGIDATAPLGSDVDYQPPRIPGFEQFPLAGRLEAAGWRRPDGSAPRQGDQG